MAAGGCSLKKARQEEAAKKAGQAAGTAAGSDVAAGRGAGASQGPRMGGVLRFGLWSPPQGLFNPLFATDRVDRLVNQFLFEPLLRFGSDLRPEPNLAATFAVAPDQRSIAFVLDDKARWHDGLPVTSDDVAFTLETVLHPRYKGPYAGQFDFIAGARAYRDGPDEHISGVLLAGERAVVVQMEKPFGPAFARLGSLPILPRHAFNGIRVTDMAGARSSRVGAVGSGPFQLEWTSGEVGAPGAAFTLRPFADYFRGRAYLDGVAFVPVGPTLNLAQLQQQVDVLELRPNDASAVSKSPAFALLEWPDRGYYYMGLNLSRKALGDVRVRQAIALALNREAMADRLFAGHGTLLNAPVFPDSWAEAPGLTAYAPDRTRAESLLTEAGWVDADGDGIREQGGQAGGRKLTLDLVFPRVNPVHGVLAALVQDALGKAGVKVELKPAEAKEMVKRVFGQQDFDLYLSDWELGLDPDASAIFGAKARGNAVGFKDQLARAYVDAGAQAVDPERRRPVYEAWTRLVNAELPYIFLFTRNEVVAVNRRVEGLVVTPLGFATGSERWWLAP